MNFPLSPENLVKRKRPQKRLIIGMVVTGHINTYIGFEILLPISTWRQRYLQVGCGGLCGSININPPETTAYKPLADGDFVLAAEDDGHSGGATTWYSNAQQRVDFAYLSYHDVANVAKGC